MTLPPAGYLAASSRTVGEMKQALEDVRRVSATIPGGVELTNITIVSGQITPLRGTHRLVAEGGMSEPDTLTHIVTTHHQDGGILLLVPQGGGLASAITVEHEAGGAGQVRLASGRDLAMRSARDALWLQRRGDDWFEVNRNIQFIQEGANILAWVKFREDSGVDIDGSFNVSGVTRNGAGDFTIDFDEAFSDAIYTVAGSGQSKTSARLFVTIRAHASDEGQQAGSVRVWTSAADGTLIDPRYCSVAIIR